MDRRLKVRIRENLDEAERISKNARAAADAGLFQEAARLRVEHDKLFNELEKILLDGDTAAGETDEHAG